MSPTAISWSSSPNRCEPLTNRAYEEELLAAIYDEDNPDGPDHDYYRGLADGLSAECITDLGCGTGMLTTTLARAGRRIIGIDPATAMLDLAASRPGGERVEWRRGASGLVDDEANDLVVMTGNVAMHILGDDWEATLNDIRRGLNPGGVVAFETRNPQARAWRRWNAPATIRDTAVGRVREAADVSAPDADGIVAMKCSNEFLEVDKVVNVTLRLQFRSFDTVTENLNAAGLRVRDIWQDWDREPFTGAEDQPLMIVEAENPAD